MSEGGQEKVLFSWRVVQGEDGSIRAEAYADPDWKGCWPRHSHHPREHRKRFGRMMPFGPMMFRRGRMGRQWARDMLDWFEDMYGEFYGGEPEGEA